MHVHGLPAPAAGSGARPHALLHGTMRSTKGLACSQRISACGRPADSDVAGACRHAQQTGRSLQRMPPALRRRLCRRGRPPPLSLRRLSAALPAPLPATHEQQAMGSRAVRVG